MRALLQRVTRARVDIREPEIEDPQARRQIGAGLVILLGVGAGDDERTAERLWQKIAKLRIFEDAEGKTNLGIGEAKGEVMVVSQFTLYASCRKGNRPGFGDAAAPADAERLYRHFLACARADGFDPAEGQFAAHMAIELENDGPFTIWLDTDELFGSPR